MNEFLELTRLCSTQLVSQWLLMLRSGMELWAALPEQATQAVRAVERDLTEGVASAKPAGAEDEEKKEEEPAETEPKPRAVSKAQQSRDDHDRYQRELIRLDAHQIWLRRKQEGIEGDPVSDWVAAERQYYSRG